MHLEILQLWHFVALLHRAIVACVEATCHR